MAVFDVMRSYGFDVRWSIQKDYNVDVLFVKADINKSRA